MEAGAEADRQRGRQVVRQTGGGRQVGRQQVVRQTGGEAAGLESDRWRQVGRQTGGEATGGQADR